MDKLTPAEAKALKKARRAGDLSDPTPEIPKYDSTAKTGAAVVEVAQTVKSDNVEPTAIQRTSLFGAREPQKIKEAEYVSDATDLTRRELPEETALPKREFSKPTVLPSRNNSSSAIDGAEETNSGSTSLTVIEGGKMTPKFMTAGQWARVNPESQQPLNQAAARNEIQANTISVIEPTDNTEKPQEKLSGPLVFEKPDEGADTVNKTTS